MCCVFYRNERNGRNVLKSYETPKSIVYSSYSGIPSREARDETVALVASVAVAIL